MVDPHDSQALTEAARAGDREAFERLILQHRRRIRSLVASRLNAHIVFGVCVDDVYQETLLRAYQSIGRFEWRGKDSLFHWLGGIAENVILQVARKRARERGTPLNEDVPVDQVSASRALGREERFRRLEESLDDLTSEHREVIMFVRVEGLTLAEAAKRMGRSPDAVKKLLYRALKNLKAAFGETESLHLPDRSLERAEGKGDE
ncbi:MAG: RNA polymerase sigma factor [Spirochaetales bacterium]|nr:RNA polymerase sigma factor [Spirochaetales bacterium]